jgi:hypothetical protein
VEEVGKAEEERAMRWTASESWALEWAAMAAKA